MSDTPAPTVPAKTKAAPAPGTPVKGEPVATAVTGQKLRDTQIKKFPPLSLKPNGFGAYDTLTVMAPADWTPDDVLRSEAWANVAGMVAKDSANTRPDMLGSLIEVRTSDHSWFMELYIRSVVHDQLRHPVGLEVVCIGPAVDPKTGKACPIDLATGAPWAGR